MIFKVLTRPSKCLLHYPQRRCNLFLAGALNILYFVVNSLICCILGYFFLQKFQEMKGKSNFRVKSVCRVFEWKKFILVYTLETLAMGCNFNFDKIYVFFGLNFLFTWNHLGVRFWTFRRSGSDLLGTFSWTVWVPWL